jgi:hypothetical protein
VALGADGAHFRREAQVSKSKADDNPAQPTDFEHSLEKTLVASTRQRVSIMGMLNQSFTIFILSTIVVGLFGYFFTRYSECRSRVVAHAIKWQSLKEEVDGRILTLAHFNEVSGTSIETWVAQLDPARSFYLLEFKGQSVQDLTNQINILRLGDSDLGISAGNTTLDDKLVFLRLVNECIAKAQLLKERGDHRTLEQILADPSCHVTGAFSANGSLSAFIESHKIAHHSFDYTTPEQSRTCVWFAFGF